MNLIKKLASLTGAATETAAENLDASIAANFPKVYSKAAFNQLTAQKDEWGRKLFDAQDRLKREKADVERVKSRIEQINNTLASGGAYSQQAYEQAQGEKKSQIMAAALALRAEKDRLEKQLPNEEAEVTTATNRLDRVQRIYDTFKVNLENFERKSKESQDKLAEAKDRQAEATLRAQEAAALDNIGGAFNGLTAAMEGMNRAIVDAERDASLAERKADERAASSGANVDQLLAQANQPAKRADPWAA
jgi:uncharacterized protein YlxW (UPF0749 family)